MAKLKVWKCFSVWMVLVLVLGLGVGIVPASPVRAATINVPGDYATIQAAINAASSGDTINVAAGTYDEQVVIDKSLTLQGVGDTTIIQPSQETANTFQLFPRKPTGSGDDTAPIVVATTSGDIVNIQGLKIDGSLVSSVPGVASLFAGILYRDTSGTIDTATIEDINIVNGNGIYLVGHDVAVNVEVRNCSISGYLKNGITANYPNMSANVHNNTVAGMGPTDAIAQNGIQFGFGATGAISNNNVSGNLWTGTYGGSNDPATDIEADGATGILLYHPGSADIEIQLNTLTANQFGIWAVGATSINIHDNDITGIAHTGSAYPTGIAVWDTDMWGGGFGYTEVGTTGSINQNTFTSNDYGILVRDYTAGGALPNVSVTDNDFSNNNIQLTDTAGTLDIDVILSTNDFDRAVAVDHPAGSPLHTVWSKIKDAISAAQAGDTVRVAAGTYDEGQISISSAVSIIGDPLEKPVIRPVTNLTGNGAGDAWFFVGSGVTFSLSNIVLDGSGFFIHQAIRSHGLTTIDNVDFSTIQGSASGSPYRGTAISSFGGTVVGGAGSDSHGGGGSPSHLVVSGSTFEQIGRIGVLVKGTESTAEIAGCTYTGKGNGDWLDYAVEVGAGGAITVGGATPAESCTITNCRGVASVDGSTSAGILVTTYYGAGTQATITGNTLADNTEGITVGYNASDTSTVGAHYNNITGNTDYGISTTAPAVDASNNWWGANDGPSGPGSGDKVSTNVDYDPWLVLNISADPTSIVVGGAATSAITADMTMNSDHEDTSGSGHIPDGTQITFTTDKGSVGSLTVDKTTTNGIAAATLTSSNTVETATVTASAPPHTVVATVSTTVNFVEGLPQQIDSATGTGTVSFSSNLGNITGLTAVAEGTLPTAGKPAGVVFLYGLFSFNITNIAPGTTVTVTITLPFAIPAGAQYWKCQGGTWINCTSLLGDNDGDNVLTLTITDGGLGDSDGVANGTIVDPGGPGVGFDGGGGFGGGGGGGGGMPALAGAYPVTLTANIQGNIATVGMTNEGVLGETLIAKDAAGKYRLEIDKDAKVMLADNKVPLLLRFREASTKPPTPENTVIVGPVYEFNAYSSTSATTPSPMTISPPARLILTYDPDKLPKNASEVFIANYDTEKGWLALAPTPGAVAEIDKAYGLVSHFTPFAVLAKLTPAKFEVSNFTVSPPQAELNQKVNISLNVANTGGTSGSYILELKVNGISKSTKHITVAADTSQSVNFTIIGDTVGKHQVEVAGLAGEFEVTKAAKPSQIIWWPIGGITIILVLAIGLILWRRRLRSY